MTVTTLRCSVLRTKYTTRNKHAYKRPELSMTKGEKGNTIVPRNNILGCSFPPDSLLRGHNREIDTANEQVSCHQTLFLPKLGCRTVGTSTFSNLFIPILTVCSCASISQTCKGLIKPRTGKTQTPQTTQQHSMAISHIQPETATSTTVVTNKMTKPTTTKRKDAENAPIFLRSKSKMNHMSQKARYCRVRCRIAYGFYTVVTKVAAETCAV